jgi:hypothetical protein
MMYNQSAALWCYWDWCGIQHSVCLPNAHPSFTSLHTQVKVDAISYYLPNLTVHTKNLWPLFYIPLHAFKMSEWAFALQPNIPPILIHSQQHAFYSLDTQSGCVLPMYNKGAKYWFRSSKHMPLLISAQFRLQRHKMLLTCSTTPYWHCRCGIWMTSST